MPIHRARTGSTTNLGSIAHDARAELAPSALPASPASLTPPAAGRVFDRCAATQERGAKRNGTQAATEPLAAQEQDPRAAKRLRRAEAQQRLAEKRKAARTETLQEKYGISTEEEREALGAGFAAADGKPNMPEYRKLIKERRAFAAGFVNPDGKPDVSAYNLRAMERRALHAGLFTPDGRPDVSALNLQLTKRKALNAGFAAADGKPNMPEYHKLIKERSALNAGFVTPEGEPFGGGLTEIHPAAAWRSRGRAGSRIG